MGLYTYIVVVSYTGTTTAVVSKILMSVVFTGVKMFIFQAHLKNQHSLHGKIKFPLYVL